MNFLLHVLLNLSITPLPAEELYELYHLMIKGGVRLRSVLKFMRAHSELRRQTNSNRWTSINLTATSTKSSTLAVKVNETRGIAPVSLKKMGTKFSSNMHRKFLTLLQRQKNHFAKRRMPQ